MGHEHDDEQTKLTWWQRAGIKALRRKAGRRDGEPLKPEDWEIAWRLHETGLGGVMSSVLRVLPHSPRCAVCAAPFAGAGRLGRRIDPSALRRRYKRGCAAAGLRPVRLHGLRHAAGSLIARTADPVFVRDFLGHAKLATTDRYLSAKLRPEELERLDAAFTPARLEPAEAS